MDKIDKMEEPTKTATQSAMQIETQSEQTTVQSMYGCYILVVDDRERYFATIADELNVPYKIERLDIGDFCLMVNGACRAVFERKTLADQAASLKDGRHENKTQMLELRAATGCDVYYIIEGNMHREVDINGVPFKAIKSSIMHIIVRDKIQVLWSLNERNTVSMLADLLKSYEEFYPPPPMSSPTNAGASMATITENIKDHRQLRAMWCSIQGINKATAEMFFKFRMIDVFTRDAPTLAKIGGLKYPSGRKLSSDLTSRLNNISSDDMISILASVRQITEVAAAEIIKVIKTPTDWKNCTAEQLSNIAGSPRRKLGKHGAHLFKLLYMTI